MSIPRNISARSFIKRLNELGYQVSRRRGSHIRLTTHQNGEHHITVPDHDPLRAGTLSGLLNDIASHFEVTKSDLVEKIFPE